MNKIFYLIIFVGIFFCLQLFSITGCSEKKPLDKDEKKYQDTIKNLRAQVRERDSLLFMWFNDYPFHIQVLNGKCRDTSVIKYQKWSWNGKSR